MDKQEILKEIRRLVTASISERREAFKALQQGDRQRGKEHYDLSVQHKLNALSYAKAKGIGPQQVLDIIDSVQ